MELLGWDESIQIHILQPFLTVPMYIICILQLIMEPPPYVSYIFHFLLSAPRIFCSLFIALKFMQPTQFHFMACFAPSLQSCVIRLAIDSFVCIPQKRKCFLFVTFFSVSESWSCMLYVHVCALWYMQTAAVVLASNINCGKQAVLNVFGSWCNLSLWFRI